MTSCSVAKSCLTLQPHGLQPARLLCSWDYPGKNTRVGWHFFLQEIFQTQGSNPYLLCFLHWWADTLPLSHLGSCWMTYFTLTKDLLKIPLSKHSPILRCWGEETSTYEFGAHCSAHYKLGVFRRQEFWSGHRSRAKAGPGAAAVGEGRPTFYFACLIPCLVQPS